MKKMKLLMSLSSATVVLTAISMVATSCSNNKLEQPKEIPESKPDEGAPVAKTPETKPSESSDPEEKETPVDTKTPEEVKNPTGGEGEDNPKDDDNKGLTDQQKPANEQPTPSEPVVAKHELTIKANNAKIFVGGKEITSWPLELDEGEKIDITLDIERGYTFTGWGDGGTRANRSYIMPNKNTTLIANTEELKKFNVSVSTINDRGTVDLTIDGTKTTVDIDNPYNNPDYKFSHILIEPKAKDGYVFSHWNNDSKDTYPKKEFDLIKDVSYVAHFVLQQKHSLRFSSIANGYVYVNGEPANSILYMHEFNHNEVVTVEAKAKDGYKFSHWEDDENNKKPQRTITMSSTVTLRPVFVEVIPKVVIKSDIGGSVAVFDENNNVLWTATDTESIDKTIKYGSKIKILATHADGYEFSHWNNKRNDIKFAKELTVKNDIDYTAHFIKATHNVKIEQAEGGVIYVYRDNEFMGDTANKPFSNEFANWTSLRIKVEPNSGYKFTKWDKDTLKKESENEYILILGEEDISLAAFFEQKMDSIAIKATEGGVVSLFNNDDFVDDTTKSESINNEFGEGTLLKVKVKPIDGYRFNGWTGESTSFIRTTEQDDSYDLLVGKNNIGLVANFIPIPQPKEETTKNSFEFYIPKAENGHVVVNDDFITAIPNCIPFSNGIKVKAIPYNRCYKFDRWSDGETENPRIINESATIYPVFANEYPTLSIPQTKNVHYKINKINTTGPYTTNFKRGESITIEACTNDEYKFKQWSDGNTENPRTISMYDNWTLFAITNKNTEYKSIEWEEQQKDRILDAKYFTTVSKRVNGDSKFDVNEYAIFYRLAENTAFTQYNDPIDGKSYDVMCISGCSNNYLHIGSTDQDPNTAALNFTTCQELIDDIYKNKFDEIDSRYRDKEKYGYERLGFVWAKNKHNKWEPHVVKEILDDSFNNKIWYNPIHCSVIIPWTVDYIGEKAFDDASTSTGKKLHVVYANRYGIDSNGNSFWEGIKKDDMDWTCDDDWDDKTTITYNAKENKWIYPTILSRHGEHEMAAIINKMLEK
ncbi:MAG: InlB B-repeat-containing protein [Malacoplasma sp.]|nr:InlB B-repeat-containing protein [Malacoplasma sp.]